MTYILPSYRIYLLSSLNWIYRVNRMDSERKVSQEFNNNPKGSRPRGRKKKMVELCTNKY